MRLGTSARDRWVWGQLLLFATILAGAPWLGRQRGVTGTALRISVASFIMALGIAIALRGAADLGRSLTPATEPLHDGQLVTRGIYQMVRHPIYLGCILILTGWTVGAAGWTMGPVAFAASLLYFEGKARVEERWMHQRFPGYAAYRARTPRLLPWGWK